MNQDIVLGVKILIFNQLSTGKKSQRPAAWKHEMMHEIPPFDEKFPYKSISGIFVK